MPDVDLAALVEDIYAEARARRASGEFPPQLARELDAEFARLAPAGAAGDDLGALIEAAERASFVDVDVPTASNAPGVHYVKKALRKGMAWYLRYLAQQVQSLGHATTRALRALDDRVEQLEAVSPGASERVREELAQLGALTVPAGAADATDAALGAGLPGRVLVADAVDVAFTAALERPDRPGRSVYGTAPRGSWHVAAARAGLEVRTEGALAHLRSLGAGALGAVVLVSVCDTAPVAAQLELLDQAVRTVATGGRVVVVATDPAAWAVLDDGLRAELSTGRPLRAATWARLLTSRGVHDVTVVTLDGGAVVSGRV